MDFLSFHCICFNPTLYPPFHRNDFFFCDHCIFIQLLFSIPKLYIVGDVRLSEAPHGIWLPHNPIIFVVRFLLCQSIFFLLTSVTRAHCIYWETRHLFKRYYTFGIYPIGAMWYLQTQHHEAIRETCEFTTSHPYSMRFQ